MAKTANTAKSLSPILKNAYSSERKQKRKAYHFDKLKKRLRKNRKL